MRLFLIISLLIVSIMPGFSQEAAVRRPGSISGSVVVEVSGDVKVRDIFEISRGGKVLGQAMVLEVKGREAVLVPMASFQGSIARTDQIVFKKHAPVPVVQETPKPAATSTPAVSNPPGSRPGPGGPQGAGARQGPGTRAGGAQSALVVDKAQHVMNATHEKSGTELHGTVTLRNGGAAVATRINVLVAIGGSKSSYTLADLAPGASGTVEWSSFLAPHIPPSGPTTIEVHYVIDGREAAVTAFSRPEQPESRPKTPGGAPAGY